MTEKVETAIIANTSLVWPDLPKKVYFMHGNTKEIMAHLQSLSDGPKTKDKKYPLIALFRDIREEVEQQRFGLASTFKAHVGIFTLTNPEMRAADRELRTFKPVLIPIFEELVNQISKSILFGSPRINDMAIKKWDCYFYGSALNPDRASGAPAGKNIFNDWVDAIEIESITLNLKNIC